MKELFIAGAWVVLVICGIILHAKKATNDDYHQFVETCNATHGHVGKKYIKSLKEMNGTLVETQVEIEFCNGANE